MKNKKKALKVIVSTFVISAAFIGGVYAGPTLEQISAYLNKGVTLTWNGEAFYPYDEDGTRVYPITYNGRTYLPVKFVAEKAGLNVGWDATTSTVSLTDENYVAPTLPKGTYIKLGDGGKQFLVADYSSLTEKGCNIEETLAENEYGTHTVKISLAFGDAEQKKTVVMNLMNVVEDFFVNNGWLLSSSTPLSNGHYNKIYNHTTQPLKIECYSTDNEVVISANRTDLTTNVVKGSYKKIGNGDIKFLTDNLEEIVADGYNVEETMATSQNGVHTTKISWASGDSLAKKQVHIKYFHNMQDILISQGWEFVSSTSLSDGHAKGVYKHTSQPLQLEMISTDEALIFTAYRTDMNLIPQTSTVSTGYEGYFASVPKPNVDSTWTEETTTELKDWSTSDKKAYTLYKTFTTSDDSKVSSAFEGYKNTLINNGFTLYKVNSDHYTYTKGDIAVKIFEGYKCITVNLSSGYQAPHYEWDF